VEQNLQDAFEVLMILVVTGRKGTNGDNIFFKCLNWI